jgi:uncharacterized protein
MIKKRKLFYQILPHLYHKNAIVITGMRQVGKTTLMKQLHNAWEGARVWFDFDNPLDQLVFENIDYNAIYEELRVGAGARLDERFLVCLDEIQNFPEITRIIKYLIDHFGVKFIVTGSSNYYLRNLFPESLSGRKFLYVLPVLSYREVLYFHDKLPEAAMEVDLDEILNIKSKVQVLRNMDLYGNYLEFGGFPEVVLTDDAETRRMILKNILPLSLKKI